MFYAKSVLWIARYKMIYFQLKQGLFSIFKYIICMQEDNLAHVIIFYYWYCFFQMYKIINIKQRVDFYFIIYKFMIFFI